MSAENETTILEKESVDEVLGTDILYIIRGTGSNRDKNATATAFVNSQLIKDSINTNEHWRTYSITPAPSKSISFPGWTKNVLLLLPTPPFDTLTITSFLLNSIMIVCPEYSEESDYSDIITLILASNSTTKTVTIPNRSIAFIHYGADGTIVGVSFLTNDDASQANKTMVSGTTLADDGYRKTQEIIVTPELTPDDGLLMTTAEILTYSENSVMKITPDWRHVVAENSLTANIYSGGSIIGVSIPYGCSAEIAYLTDKTIANIAVIPSMNYLIQTSNIKDNAVTAAKINAGAVTDAKLALNSVTELKIQNGAVTEAKHGDLSVSTAKLKNGAATSVKMATDVVFHNGTETTDLDTSYPPASYHVGYILVLEPSYIGNTSYSFSHNDSSQSVTLYAYGCIAFVCVDAGETYGHQWRPLNHFYNA